MKIPQTVRWSNKNTLIQDVVKFEKNQDSNCNCNFCKWPPNRLRNGCVDRTHTKISVEFERSIFRSNRFLAFKKNNTCQDFYHFDLILDLSIKIK